MEFCERIRLLRLNKELTQKDVGEMMGVSTVSIGHWEKGSKNPSMSAVISLAAIYGVTTDYLLGVSNNNDTDNSLLTERELSLISSYRLLDEYGRKAVDVICQTEKERVEVTKKSNVKTLKPKLSRYIPKYTTPSAAGYSVPLEGDDFEMILVDENIPDDADFAVGIQGDSMSPYIQDGDTVYVKRDAEMSVGDVGIFCVDGAMYCKQYYVDENRNLLLVSLNPKLKRTNIYVSADSNISVKCYGKVLLDNKVCIPAYIFD